MSLKKRSSLIAVIFSGLLGIIFLFSGYTKLFPIEPFEYTFVELGLSGWRSSVIIARLFIGFELGCGLLLLSNLWIRRFTIPLVGFTLVAFTVYLAIQMTLFGNRGNCGCFGEYIHFTPLEGILKNIAMLTMAIFVYQFHPGFRFRGMKWVTVALVVTAMALPFILNPVNFSISEQHYSENLRYKLELDLLYNDPKNPAPMTELREGKWVIAFLSLTCPHCKVAAKKLHVMKIKNPSLPIYMVLNGKEEDLSPFMDDTRAENIPWSMFRGPDKFIRLAGANLPAILWVDNSVVVRKSSYFFLEQKDIEAWISQ